MTETYIINPETGRTIRVGRVTFNQLIFTSYDFINNELVRRATAPPPTPQQHFYNVQTNRLIRACSRRYYEYIRAGWEIEDDYYLIPPWMSIEWQATLATNSQIHQQPRHSCTSYEQIMAIHGNRLADLNVSLCRKCLIPIGREEGDHCSECQSQ
jgi:hypothetical protein